MTAIVLDASALPAMLRDEADATVAGARMSAVNFAEVVGHFIHAGMPPDEVDAMLTPLPLIIVEADDALPGWQAYCARRRRKQACL